MYRQKASITIFGLLSMLLVMTTVLSLLELTRYQEIKNLAELQTEAALESGFANYSSYLWEKYHLLTCKDSELKTMVENAGEGRLEDGRSGNNFLLFRNTNAKLIGYTRMTDGNGAAYMHLVSSYMKRNLLYETAKQIYNQYEAIKALKESTDMDLGNVDKALEEIEKAKKEAEEKGTALAAKSIATSGKQETSVSNPLEEFKHLQKMGILELVLEDTTQLSEAEIVLDSTVSHRKLKEGNRNIEEADWLEQVWLQQYLLVYLSHYGECKEGHGLSYELEYVIGGKASDIANLKVVVGELLLMREAANFIYLMSDSEKIEEARLLAAALVGVYQNPALVEAVKIAILTVWAFGESVLDVRALLENKQIPLLKNEELWTLELENIGALTQEYGMAKEVEQGLSYKNYLGVLLLFQSKENLAMRSMDVQEATLQELYQDDNLGLDDFLVEAEAEITYEYQPVFSDIKDNASNRTWKYKIVCRKAYGYIGKVGVKGCLFGIARKFIRRLVLPSLAPIYKDLLAERHPFASTKKLLIR